MKHCGIIKKTVIHYEYIPIYLGIMLRFSDGSEDGIGSIGRKSDQTIIEYLKSLGYDMHLFDGEIKNG